MLLLTRNNKFGARAGAYAGAAVAACGLTLTAVPAAGATPLTHRPTLATAPAAVAYTYGNKPTAHSYTPERDYSYNSTGGGIGITRSGLGQYTITFGGLGAYANQGTVDVTPEGFGAAVCSVTGWGQDSSGADLQVGVDCFALSGARLNTYFEAAYTSGGSTGGTTDYVWANEPKTKTYTPDLNFQFNSSGGTNTITRLGVGRYEVMMPGPDAVDGTVKVTPFGTTADACEVVEWLNVSTGQDVYVDCFSKTAAPANDEFTATFTASNDLFGDGGTSGYLWANEPTASTYTPEAAYQWDSIGTSATVDMFTTGQWENDWPGEGFGLSPGGDQQATAYGSDDTHCIIDGPAGEPGGDETGDVYCFDNSGNPVNDYYTTQWLGT